MRVVFLTLGSLLLFLNTVHSQFGIGGTAGIDLYQYHKTPATENNSLEDYSSGSALFNFNVGPKIWVGAPKFSVSAEAQVSFAPFALDVNDYKGLGAVAFPVSIDLNFGGISGFNPLVNTGFSVGGGILFKKSELYFTEDEFSEVRDDGFHQTYFGQVAYGIGAGGLAGRLYARYAHGGENNSFFSIGINLDMNLIKSNYEVDEDELYSQ